MKHALAAHWRRVAIVLLSALGCAVVWLSHEAHTNREGAAAFFCGQVGGGCDRAFDSPWSVLPPGSDAGEFSLPMTFVGMLHFGFLLTWFLIVGIPSHTRRWWHLVPLVEVTGSLMMVVFLVWIIFTEQLWCFYCIASHIITLLLALGIFKSWPRKQLDSVESAPKPANKVAVCGLVLSCLLPIVVGQSVYPHRESMDQYQARINKLIERHFEQTPVEVFVEGNDAIQPAENQENQHTLIVFFDAQCPPCKQLLVHLEETIIPLFEGRLRVVYKHFPLASRCNRLVPDLHPHACEAAKLVEAARQQGGIGAFLQMAKLINEHQGEFDRDAIRVYSIATNLDADRIELAFDDVDISNRVKRHIQQGATLRLKGTPSVFLDGLKVAGPLLDTTAFWEVAAAKN